VSRTGGVTADANQLRGPTISGKAPVETGWSAPFHRDYTARRLYCPNASKNAVMRSNRFSLPRAL
jgi:hypothetical protein